MQNRLQDLHAGCTTCLSFASKETAVFANAAALYPNAVKVKTGFAALSTTATCLLGKDVGQCDRAARARGVSAPRVRLHLVGFVQWEVECLQESADFLPGH